MLVSRRYLHFVFGIIQSGLTSLVASGVGSAALLGQGTFFSHWMMAWLLSWGVMLPVVILAAPAIRSLAYRLTRDDDPA